MRIAALDIGTNSIHVIIVQVRPDRSFEIIDREKEMVRLGSGGLGGRSLTEPAMLAAMQANTASRSPHARRRPRGQARAGDRMRPTRGTRLPR